MTRQPTAFVSALILLSGAGLAQTPVVPRTQFIADMDAQFRKMDTDKNGGLDRAEIEQFQKLAALAETQARNRKIFADLDADKSGQLSEEEFIRINTATTANATPMLTRMDVNRDHQISLSEHRAATLFNFDRLDADRNGVVSTAEMKAGGLAPP